MGKLTTHVLDVYSGVPAATLTIEFWRIADDGTRIHITTIATNADGRAPAPLLDNNTIATGEYELVFLVRDYFTAKLAGHENPSPFLNRVPVRFTIFDSEQNYHVPLLVSPWSYSTYRGS